MPHAWTCVLVRHGEAGDRSAWQGPDDLRPLGPLGWLQAADLVDAVDDIRVRALLTSPSTRCLQTLLPLSHVTSLDVETVAGLSLHGDPSLLLAWLMSADSDGVVVCTHGEVIEDVLDGWPWMPGQQR